MQLYLPLGTQSLVAVIWGSSFYHEKAGNGAPPSSFLASQTVSASDGMPQAKHQARQGHSPNHQQAGCLKTPWALNCPGHGPVHQSVHAAYICAPEQALTHQTPYNRRLREASLTSGPVLAPIPASPTSRGVLQLLFFFNHSVVSDCDPMNWSSPVFCVLHHLLEFGITWASHRQQ